jgi:hypothetical protein
MMTIVFSYLDTKPTNFLKGILSSFNATPTTLTLYPSSKSTYPLVTASSHIPLIYGSVLMGPARLGRFSFDECGSSSPMISPVNL